MKPVDAFLDDALADDFEILHQPYFLHCHPHSSRVEDYAPTRSHVVRSWRCVSLVISIPWSCFYAVLKQDESYLGAK